MYPSYLTPPLSLNPSNPLSMSNLGLGHPNGPHGIRISPQMAAMPPMSAAMRLSPPQHVTVSQPPLSAHSSPTGLPLAPPPPSNLTSPQNLSVSSNDSISPGSPNDNSSGKIKFDDAVDGITEKNGTPGTATAAVNMTINSSTDMRTNSIATLRIKAKEHIENINKGLTIA